MCVITPRRSLNPIIMSLRSVNSERQPEIPAKHQTRGGKHQEKHFLLLEL